MKFTDLGLKDLLTECETVKGAYIRNMSFEDLSALREKLQDLDDEAIDNADDNVYSLFVWLFESVLCDADGNKFEDCATTEEVRENVPTVTAQHLIKDVTNFLTGRADSKS